jgi:hypothetical protein
MNSSVLSRKNLKEFIVDSIKNIIHNIASYTYNYLKHEPLILHRY